MKKLFYISILVFGFVLFSGCGKNVSWQGAYYNGGNADEDIVYGPIFTDYQGCKDWAISMMPNAYNNYAYCSKNCHDSVAGTPICEEVVRSWAPLPSSITFDNYVE